MHITVVGSGTVVPDGERVCSSYFVEAGDCRLLLDCGPGAVHHLARFGLPWSRLTHLALTHFHTDHVGDLPMLYFALKYGQATPRREELAVLGPGGTRGLVDRLADAFGDYLREPGFPAPIRELASGDDVELPGGARLRCHATPHTDASIAYRVETSGGALGYTGDTGGSDGLGDFFRGVDVLIAECSLPDELAIASHLTPSRVAELAARARPGRLVLTHVYPQLDRHRVPALVRQAGWDGEVVVADDGMAIRL